MQFYTAQEYPSSPIEPPNGEFKAMGLDSPLESGSTANDNPFRTPQPSPEPAGCQEPRTPPDQIIHEGDLLESDESYSDTSSPPMSSPHKPVRYRRDAEESHDHARVWLRTTEDYQRYAARKRISFDDDDGHPPSPTLPPVLNGKQLGEQEAKAVDADATGRDGPAGKDDDLMEMEERVAKFWKSKYTLLALAREGK
jgi:hypothetical protein